LAILLKIIFHGLIETCYKHRKDMKDVFSASPTGVQFSCLRAPWNSEYETNASWATFLFYVFKTYFAS